MSSDTLPLTPELLEYLQKVSLREPSVLRRLREETAAHPYASMQISPEQGQFMALLVKLIGARRTLEIGVFTGYSSTVTALALPPDGRITACDVDEDFTSIARRYWDEAGVSQKIELHMAPALDTLQQLLDQGATNSYDLAFIDADKCNYPFYYEKCLQLVRPGGVILVDNVLWGGRVANQEINDEDTGGIRRLNTIIHADDRVDVSMIPIGDGLTLARKH
jgi:predicted O-methyltransferase YrrM